MSLAVGLDSGLGALGLELSQAQRNQLLGYLDLLAKWSKVYNLTAVRDPAEMLTHHILDCLAIVGPLRRQTGGAAGRLLDVGSGAGLPGAVIAICCPELKVDCLDAVGKKAAFIQQAAGTLGLPNLRGVHGRIESTSGGYDVVSSRAFASLADFVTGSRQALAGQGVWLAMKGKRPVDEMAQLPADVTVFHVEQLDVPGLLADRCIVWMRVGEDR